MMKVIPVRLPWWGLSGISEATCTIICITVLCTIRAPMCIYYNYVCMHACTFDYTHQKNACVYM